MGQVDLLLAALPKKALDLIAAIGEGFGLCRGLCRCSWRNWLFSYNGLLVTIQHPVCGFEEVEGFGVLRI